MGKVLCGWHPMYYPNEAVPVLGEFPQDGDSHGICDRCRVKFEAEVKPVGLKKRNNSAGKRADLGGLYVRSAWEANYARYLDWLVQIGDIRGWEYEPVTFEFHAIKRGTRFYTPDFKVTNCDGSVEYHEVKGWMDPKSKTKLKRMKRYYPDVPVTVIDADAYRALARDVSGFIPNWE
jgi:hypothetical protein